MSSRLYRSLPREHPGFFDFGCRAPRPYGSCSQEMRSPKNQVRFSEGERVVIDYWSDTDSLAKLAKVVPYAFIALGFLVAMSGQFVRTRIDSRVAELNKSAEAQRKNTPPLIDVRLGNSSSSTGEILLEIKAENEIPFTARWSVLTTRNELVSGILLEDFEAHPTKERNRFVAKVPIQGEKVQENYIELHFTFTSRYSAELNNPPNLKGEIVKKYRYSNGRISSRVE